MRYFTHKGTGQDPDWSNPVYFAVGKEVYSRLNASRTAERFSTATPFSMYGSNRHCSTAAIAADGTTVTTAVADTTTYNPELSVDINNGAFRR